DKKKIEKKNDYATATGATFPFLAFASIAAACFSCSVGCVVGARTVSLPPFVGASCFTCTAGGVAGAFRLVGSLVLLEVVPPPLPLVVLSVEDLCPLTMANLPSFLSAAAFFSVATRPRGFHDRAVPLFLNAASSTSSTLAPLRSCARHH